MKRSIIFLVLCAMVIGCFAPVPVLAATEPEVITVSYEHKNPLYENFVFQKKLLATETYDTGAAYYDTISEAAAVLRAGLENRAAAIRVDYATASGYSNDLHYQIFQEATKHTGVPTQGDYLLWHYGGYGANVSYYIDGGITYVSFTYNMQYLSTLQMERKMEIAVDTLLRELNVDRKTDYEKVCAVYDYICQNITYDYDGLEAGSNTAYTAYGALINKTSVCQGYASLFYRLMLELGVDTRVIPGIGAGGNHGWNIVELSGLYYNLDSTWDAIYWEAGLDYNYFLKSDENFDDHQRSSEYATTAFYREYPMSAADYVPEPIGKDFITDSAGNHYYSIEAALASVKSGDTISLLDNVTTGDLILPYGVSLDLNGYTLTADSVLTYRSNGIIDSSENVSGLLKIKEAEGNMISADNVQLPVYDHTADGYRFFSVAVFSHTVTGKNANTPKAWFKIQAENMAQLYNLISSGSEMEIKLKMTWDGQTEETYAVATLAFTQTWADKYYAKSNVYVTVTLEDIQDLKNVTVTPCVAANGVEIQSPESISIPNNQIDNSETADYPYSVTYEKYMEMTAAEQATFYDSFKDHNDFKVWREAAKKAYDDSKVEIEMGPDGSIDLGGMTGGQK